MTIHFQSHSKMANHINASLYDDYSDFSNYSNHSIDDKCVSNSDPDFLQTWDTMLYWCEGLLMLPVGAIGFVGNVLAIIILSIG